MCPGSARCPGCWPARSVACWAAAPSATCCGLAFPPTWVPACAGRNPKEEEGEGEEEEREGEEEEEEREGEEEEVEKEGEEEGRKKGRRKWSKDAMALRKRCVGHFISVPVG